MKAVFDHRRTVFIHDFDGVYYRYTDIENFVDFLCDCGGMAGAGLLPSLDRAAAKQIHHDSFFTHGMAHIGFLDIAASHGFDARAFTSAYYRDYHKHAYARSKNECPDWLRPSPTRRQLFEQLGSVVRHGLLTQSHLDEWALPSLKDMGLLQHFEPACLLGFEECNHELKPLSTRPLEKAMDHMNAAPWQTVFIEDSPKNLLKAKELHPDICTVFVCHDKPIMDVPAYIDIQVDSLDRFIQAAIRFHNAPKTPALAI